MQGIDVTIHKLRTEGAFLVSAVRKGGQTRFIRIESLAGEPCVVVTDMPDPKGAGVTVTKVGDRAFKLGLRKGQSVVLTPGGTTVDLTIAPVAPQVDRTNYWGLNARTPARQEVNSR